MMGRALATAKTSLGDKLEFALAVCSVLERMSAGLGVEEVCDQLYESMHVLLPYDRIGLAVVSEDGTRALSRWARSSTRRLTLDHGYTAELEGSSLQQLVEDGEPRIIDDLEAYARQHPSSESTRLILAEGVRSSLTFPLQVDDEVVGILFFSSREKRTYDRAHTAIFQTVATQVATAIERGRLYEESLELNLFKNRLLGVVAHDVRGPLVEFAEHLRLLDAGAYGTMPQAAARVLRRLEQKTQRMRARIDALLDAGKVRAGELELRLVTVEIQDYLEERFRDLSLLAIAKSLDLLLDVEPNLPDVRIDPVRIEQVLSNLVANAARHSYPGATITIGARRVEEEIEIFVSDKGTGIPRDELFALFTGAGSINVGPPDRAQRPGIGLAIAQQVIAAHGGTLNADSIVGEGSTFAFSLPISSHNVPAHAAHDEIDIVES